MNTDNTAYVHSEIKVKQRASIEITIIAMEKDNKRSTFLCLNERTCNKFIINLEIIIETTNYTVVLTTHGFV